MVTRASLAVKRPGAKPLPMHLQCHPKALTKTPRNPGCIKNHEPHWGLGRFGLTQTREEMLAGEGLDLTGRFSIVHTATGDVLGLTDDVTLAMAFKVRGEQRALYLEVVDNETDGYV
jgi:hypothetical protein